MNVFNLVWIELIVLVFVICRYNFDYLMCVWNVKTEKQIQFWWSLIFWLLNNVWYDNAVSNICWMFFEGKCMLLYVVFGVNLIFVSDVAIRLLSDLVGRYFVRGVCVSNDVVLLLLIGVVLWKVDDLLLRVIVGFVDAETAPIV